jgi:hypothetical protein
MANKKGNGFVVVSKAEPNPYRGVDYVNAPTGEYFYVEGIKNKHFATLAEAMSERDEVEREGRLAIRQLWRKEQHEKNQQTIS